MTATTASATTSSSTAFADRISPLGYPSESWTYPPSYDGSLHEAFTVSNEMFSSLSSDLYPYHKSLSFDGYSSATGSTEETSQHNSNPALKKANNSTPAAASPSPAPSDTANTNSSNSSVIEGNTPGSSSGQSKKERRRIMNRASQRAYRARKEAQLTQFQETITTLKGQIEDLERQRIGLIALNEYLINQNRHLTMMRDMS